MKKILLLALAVLCLAGCKTAPIQNVQAQPVPHKIGMAKVERAIVEGGAQLGWKMVKTKPGLIIGTLNNRQHTAVVEIPYSSESYSILYKSSDNLNADDKGNIHKSYNRWIKNLDKEIGIRLTTLSYQ